MIKIYGQVASRTARCLWTAAEIELEFEHIKINQQAGESHTPEFLKINPNGHVPALVDGKTVLLTAHENSIRALMGHIEQIPAAEIPTVNIASGVLLMYTFDRSMNLKERYTYTKDCQVLL